MLHRWFFYQTRRLDDRERIETQTALMPCLGRIPLWEQPTDFFLSQSKDALVLGMRYGAFKAATTSWTRSDIPAVVPQILRGESLVRRSGLPTFLVWARDEILWPGDPQNLRVVDPEDAQAEAACLWAWIEHVCAAPINVQKMGQMHQEFQTWLKRQDLRLPDPIRPLKPFSSH